MESIWLADDNPLSVCRENSDRCGGVKDVADQERYDDDGDVLVSSVLFEWNFDPIEAFDTGNTITAGEFVVKVPMERFDETL